MIQQKALVLAAFGARGTGKTAWVKQQLEAMKPKRLIIWDFKNDPALEGVGKEFTDIGAFIRAMRGPAFKLRFLVDQRKDYHSDFEHFCQAAFQVGCLTMFVDELPEVTKANKAPPAWRRCVNVGRDYKDATTGERKWLSIIGAGQRTAECDKSFIGNADVLHTGRMKNSGDAKELAQSIGCRFDEILKLPDLHFIESRVGEIEPVRGILKFSKNKSR